MSGYIGLLLLGMADFCSADLRMASWPKGGYLLRDQGSVQWNITDEWHYRYMEPSTFGYKGLEHQKARNYDNFLRSNIDNEQDNRDFNKEDGKDHLPFRSYEAEVYDTYLWKVGRVNNIYQRDEQKSLAYEVSPGDTMTVPFRWNNPHAAEMEINIWIFDHAGKQPIVVPIRKPSCSGEGYQNNIVDFTVPKDFADLGAKIPGFKGCSETSSPMCTLQVYSHSVESRTYSSGFPIVVSGHNTSLTTSDSKGIQAATLDPWLDLSGLRDICLPATDPSANIPTAMPRWARLVSDVYNHAYQNSDYSPYSGQQQEFISKNLQASAINKMEVGNRGELGKNQLPTELYNTLRNLRNLEDRIYKNYEALANKIIKKVGGKMQNSGTVGSQKLARCFRCAEAGSTKNQRLETNTYIPSFQLPTGETSACSDGQIKAADSTLKVLSSISSGTRFVPMISFDGEDYPVCGHYFWDNYYGAQTLCKQLGFTNGRSYRTRQTYGVDAMPVGRCRPNEPLTGCTQALNGFGDLNYNNGYCKAGKAVGVQVYCSGGSSSNYKIASAKTTCKDLYAEARALVPTAYKQLVSDSGLVQIYVSASKDLMPFFYKARHLGVIYQEAVLKTTGDTMSDATNFKKINAAGKVDGGAYAYMQAKKAFVADKGCPSQCLYAKPAHKKAAISNKDAFGVKSNDVTAWALTSQTLIGGAGMKEPKLVTLRLNLEANVWIVGCMDGSMLKMVKLEITGPYDYKMIAAKSKTNASSSCMSPATFTEDCFTGAASSPDEYKVMTPPFAPAPGGGVGVFADRWYCVSSSTAKYVKGPFPDLESAKTELNKVKVNSSFRQQICEMTVSGAKSDPRRIGPNNEYQRTSHGFQTMHPSYHRDIRPMNDLCNKQDKCRTNGAPPIAARTAWYCVVSDTKKTVSGPYSDLTMAKKELNKTLASRSVRQMICEMSANGAKTDYNKIGGQTQSPLNGFQSSWPSGGGDINRMRDMCNKNDKCRYNGAIPAANPSAWFCVAHYKSSTSSYVKGPFSDISEAKKELNKHKASRSMYQQICEMTEHGAKKDPHKVGGQNQGAKEINGFQTSWPRGWGSINHLNNMCNKFAPCKLNVPMDHIEEPIVKGSIGTNVTGECSKCTQFFGKTVHTIKKPKATKLALKVAKKGLPSNVGALSNNPDDEPHTPGRRRRRSDASLLQTDEKTNKAQNKSKKGKKRQRSYKLIGDFIKHSHEDFDVSKIKVLSKVKPLPVADDC